MKHFSVRMQLSKAECKEKSLKKSKDTTESRVAFVDLRRASCTKAVTTRTVKATITDTTTARPTRTTRPRRSRRISRNARQGQKNAEDINFHLVAQHGGGVDSNAPCRRKSVPTEDRFVQRRTEGQKDRKTGRQKDRRRTEENEEKDLKGDGRHGTS